jgi:hypothetical protein
VLLHRLAGLGGDAWKGDTHTHTYGHPRFDGNSHTAGLADIWIFPHPQPAYPYVDIYSYRNIHCHSHDHTHRCAFVDSVPAAHIDTYSHSNTGAANGDVHGLTNAYLHPRPTNGNIHSYACAANGDVYVATECNQHRDPHAYGSAGAISLFPFKTVKNHA